jgi:uncharacterized membrane protein YbhN (UPF0104 family)
MTDKRQCNLAAGILTAAADPAQDHKPWPGRILRLLLRWGLPLAILAVLGYLLFSRLSFRELVGILSRAEPGWLLIGLFFYVLTNVLRAARMVKLLACPYSHTMYLLPVMFAVSLFNNVLPMRTGELSFPYLVQKDGMDYGRSLVALLISRLFDLLAVCSLFVLAAVCQYAVLSESVVRLIVVAVGAAFLLIVLLASLPALGRRVVHLLHAGVPGETKPVSGWRAVVSEQAEKAATALDMMHSKRTYWLAVVHSLLIWLCTYAWFASYLQGIGLPTGFGRTILGASFAALSKSLPIGSIGGFGTHEAGWALGFTLLGQETGEAILGGFAVNLLTLFASALCGLSSLAWLALRNGRSLRHYLAGTIGTARKTETDGTFLTRQLKRHRAIAVIVLLFVVLGTLYSIVTPLFETPDEVWHYLYVKHFADGKGLPVYEEGVTFPMRQEASQPPLYYLLNGWATVWIDTSDVETVIQYNPHAAIGTPSASGNRNVTSHTPYEDFPYRGTVLAAHLSRLLSVLMGVGAVVCTYAIARRLFPHPDWLAPAAAGFNAFIPQFIFIHASVNNDVLTTLLAALSLWLVVCIAQDGASIRRLCALGAVLGLAALSKLNGLVLVPLSAVVLIALAYRSGRKWAFVRWGLYTYASAALVGGWWYLRNWMLYGDPFGLNLMFTVMPKRAQRPSLTELLHLLDGALKSFFGVFGWFNIAMEPWMYQLLEFGLVAALLGLARFLYLRFVQRRRAEIERAGLLVLWSAAFIAALVGWTQARWPQGRLLFPAISAICILFVLGLRQWLPLRYARPGILALLAALVALAALVPYRYIAPAYARARPLTTAELMAISQPMSVEFGQQVRLLGYDLSEDTVSAGSRVWLTLYWEGLTAIDRDHSVFIHLVDARGVTVAQRDSYPGSGNDPTRSWEPGQAIRDVHPLDVPAILLAQGPFRIQIGLYEYDTGQRLTTRDLEGEVADFVQLPTILYPSEQSAAALHELDLVFEELIALTGYSVEPLVVRPGGKLKVVLRWQALADVREDFTVFVQLIRGRDEIWGQSDHVPRSGQAPTSTWKANALVIDEFVVDLSPDAPDGMYQFAMGLYRPATVKRLKLADGTDTVVLGTIAVRSQ